MRWATVSRSLDYDTRTKTQTHTHLHKFTNILITGYGGELWLRIKRSLLHWFMILYKSSGNVRSLSLSLSLSALEVIYWSSFPFFFFYSLLHEYVLCYPETEHVFYSRQSSGKNRRKKQNKKTQTICIQRWIKMRRNNTTRSRAQIARMRSMVTFTSQLCMCDVYMKATQINISMFSVISVPFDGIPVAMLL